MQESIWGCRGGLPFTRLHQIPFWSVEERICRLLQRRLHRTLPAQTLQPFSPPAAHDVEPSRGKARPFFDFNVFSFGNGRNSEINLSFFFFSAQAQCANFEYMLWFESLLFYGFEENSVLQRGDGDISLLPSIVEKVVLSKLTGRVTHTAAPRILRFARHKKAGSNKICHVYSCVCVSVLAEQVWDPLSNSQTARVVGFIRRLMKSYPTVLHGENRYTQVLCAFIT